MKNQLIIFLSVFFSSQLFFAQDPVFYSTNNLHLYNNPAMSGMNKSFSVDFGLSNQWASLSGNYISSVTSVNQYLGKGNGVSIMFFTDNAGDVTFKRELDLGYSKRFELREGHFLALGVQAAFFQGHLDISKLTFGDMIDPRTGYVYPDYELRQTTIYNVDAHAGLLYYNDYLYTSFSVKHLLQPNESFFAGESRLPMLYFGEIGGKINLGDVRFVPYARYRTQNSFNMFQAGLKVTYLGGYLEGGLQNENTFYTGLGYSGKQIKAGYNLVTYTSRLQSSNFFTHEIFLGFNLNLFKKENEHFFDF